MPPSCPIYVHGGQLDTRFSGFRVVDWDTIVIGERVTRITGRSIVGGNMPSDREWMDRAGYAEKE